ncbi:MAG: phage tail tape measure protein [Methyloceanibacter sp.]|nr:phage tail tape measure protein [Methyloceanibacter sp.]
MAFGMGGAVESIFVELGLDPQKFFTGVDNAVTQGGQKVEQFGQKSSGVMKGIAAAAAIAGAAVLGIFSVKTIKDAVNYTEEYAGEVRKLARETGMTAEKSSEMLYAFRHVGLDSDSASASLGILAKKLKGVSDEETGVTTGGKSTAAILADIGIQATDAEGNLRPMGDLIPEISDAFAKMPDGVEKTGLAMQLFGRSGKDMIPLLNLGSQGMAELADEANKLGLVLSAENADKIKEYTLAQRTLKEAVGGVKLVIGMALIPVLTKALKWLVTMQPAIREGLGKAVTWLGKTFGTLGRYILATLKTGDALNDYLADLPAPLKLLAYLIGETVLSLKDIAEWLLKAADKLVDWGRKVAGFLPDGKSMGDHFDTLKRVVPLVADAIGLVIAAMVVSTVLSFALAIGKVALQFLTFPIRELGVAVGAIKDFVTAAAGLVSKAITITQNVVSTGAEIIRSLPWVFGEVEQMVRRTGAKIIDKLNPITGTVTQSVEVTPPADAGEKAEGWFAALMANILGGLGGSPEVLKAIGLFASGVLAGIGAAVGGSAFISGLTATFGTAFSTAFAGVAAFLAAIPVAGWIALAIIVVVLIVAALAIIFREKLMAFFTGPFPKFFTDALPAFAKSLPGWAGQLAGMIAAAVVFALLGIPILIIQKLAEGLKAAGPVVAKAIGGALKGVGGAVLATLAGIPWGRIAGAIGKGLQTAGGAIRDFAESIPGWIVAAVKEIPGLFWNALKAIPGLLADAGGAIQRFARSIPGWIAEGLVAIPGLVAAIPGWFGDALGAIPGLARAALEGAGGLIGIVAGALGDVLGAIRDTPVGEAVGALMGELWSGFQTGWQRVNELTGGALNDLVSGIAGLPGRLIGFVGDLLGAGADLGGAIFDGIMAGLKAVPEALGDLAGVLKEVFKTAINAGIRAINAIIPDKLGVSIVGRWIGFNIPDNPIPLLDFGGGGIVPGPMGAPVLSIVHGGEHITEPGPAPIFNFNMPLSMTGYDLEGMRRLIHAEVDVAFNDAARRAYLAGAPLRGGIG